MTGIAVQIEVGGDLRRALSRAAEASADLTGPMQEIAVHLAATTVERFDQERDPTGMPWKPSRRTLEEPGAKTLNLSGFLRQSIEPDWGRDYAAAGVEASGGPAVYAAVHQFGATITPRTAKALSFAGRVVARAVIPARPFLGFSDENRAFALDVITDHLAEVFGGTPS
ncbi:phage virion morphogenesis protein [Sphingomonas changnyeongensis]|uniref:Phage virion morphogenesis protein n=1 Tax=Sphingomonas changnyeongensis TaxID=2698679 RepID=A0A7Z2NVY0_9SPHN|nr:phage virion morphogenesis protein [Sphingomonas changnyeongensis]QHL90697.1 phage virion morphogenesis protein [Sphingomonas changnyeongensis]